ncbi:hypothetical protein ILUMI_24051 [Ignelater luminosus]|uniref:BTB domain-containing protein n=1 Tax=Ignelater luminosus TaxID=2038154 RepID=A0A8K0C7S0_IGNLU|nr:hypothetical protein ILUMI_24051 [Ignelater luminosus]
MSLPQLLEERECVDRCRCKEHGELVCAALTKRQVLDSDLCGYLHHVCCSCESVKDEMGRTALHVAASCGRMDVVKWLIQMKHANINAKDNESGYTPLHRSIFYGKVNVAVYLIKLGANVTLTDFNGLTSLEHATNDCLESDYAANQGEVYVWGSNTNYTLGPQQARSMPELLDAYHKQYPNLYVQQVCLEKFHCVLVSTDGKVFACGHGQGGRLGLGNEKTIIAPEQVKLSANGHSNPVICKKASIAIDHSVFLTESGHVWTCGLNTHRVLGIQPPPAQVLVPCPLSLMQYPIENVCAARYHTVAWGPKAIYTCGLHGGQLGHDKTVQKYIISPKLVTYLHGLGCTITAVAASNGATAVVTSKGDIYILHEYQCRKIASKRLDITSISIVGGKLNDKIDNSLSTEENHELIVIGLSKVGNLYIWKESDPVFARCIFSINRFLKIRQVTLNLNEILFVTHQGEAFQGILKPRKRKTTENNLHIKKSAFHEFLEKDNCQLLKVSKISRAHRAVSIHSDLKGRNYAVLQASPKASLTRVPDVSQSNMQEDMYMLLQDASEDDQIHDVIFKVSKRFFPAHHYIIAFNSNKLNDLITASEDKIIELSNVNEDIFEQLLLFIYTGTCDLIKIGKCPDKFQLLCKKNKKKEDLQDEEEERLDDLNISAFQYYKNEKSKSKTTSSNNDNRRDPVRLLHEASKRFGIKMLQKILDNMYYDNGFILMKKEKRFCIPLKFDRNQFPKLQDIVLRTKERKEISAHKCILAARLEYFNNLFSSRWNSESLTKEISLPFPHNVLNQLIEFLYTDNLPLLENEDIDHVCNLLILADQLFVLRLKEICECTLSTFITLKNVVQMLSFSSLYNANQLKIYCMEFICANLAAILEVRSLEMVDEDLLRDLTNFYCNYNPIMQQRIITPYSYAPSDEIVSAAGNIHHIVIDDSDCESEIKSTPKPQKKRSRPRKNASLDGNSKKERSISDSVETPNETDVGNENSTKVKTETFVEIESSSKLSNESHSTVVQTRLKAIVFAQSKTDCDNIVTEYTKLPLKPNKVEVSLDDFPELDSHHSYGLYSKSPSTKEKIDIKHKITKLSQKQRKRLSSENSSSVTEPCSPKLSESPKNPWKICTEITNISPVGSPIGPATMDSIITDEKRQKENLVKMRTKLLVHTQVEDKAIEDLYKFYNVDNVFDEIVVINRVQIGLVASPVWVHASKTK